MLGDLPDGVSVYDLPGSTEEDEAAESFREELVSFVEHLLRDRRFRCLSKRRVVFEIECAADAFWDDGRCAVVIWNGGSTLLPEPHFVIYSNSRGWLGVARTPGTTQWFCGRLPTADFGEDLLEILQRFGILTDPPEVVEVAVAIPDVV